MEKNPKLKIDPYWLLEATIHQEGRRIFNLAYRLCGNREEAQEIARETFVRAIGDRRFFEGRSQIYAFLYRVAFGVWKSRLRRAAGRRAANPEAAAGDGRARVIRRGLSSLPAAEQFAVTLRDMEGKSYLEIAHIMDCGYGTVRSHLARAREKLRATLLPDPEGPK